MILTLSVPLKRWITLSILPSFFAKRNSKFNFGRWTDKQQHVRCVQLKLKRQDLGGKGRCVHQVQRCGTGQPVPSPLCLAPVMSLNGSARWSQEREEAEDVIFNGCNPCDRNLLNATNKNV